ncbi:hypothetical protein QJS10_CPB20g00752 [Acorus calamus]|uniref:Uncharacterized protein n=1 Tax=Acorus calamus TaxID=4465 RepID=A0AAV9CCZ9_ACOCL|nr:hypothetical protein QJS10_CPB20g00752 [Acorus calamus]
MELRLKRKAFPLQQDAFDPVGRNETSFIDPLSDALSIDLLDTEQASEMNDSFIEKASTSSSVLQPIADSSGGHVNSSGSSSIFGMEKNDSPMKKRRLRVSKEGLGNKQKYGSSISVTLSKNKKESQNITFINEKNIAEKEKKQSDDKDKKQSGQKIKASQNPQECKSAYLEHGIPSGPHMVIALMQKA